MDLTTVRYQCDFCGKWNVATEECPCKFQDEERDEFDFDYDEEEERNVIAVFSFFAAFLCASNSE